MITRNPLLNIPNMPNVSVASILEEGDLFEDNGFVKIKKGKCNICYNKCRHISNRNSNGGDIMTDILIMPDGSRWKPSTSTDVVECANCG